MDSVVFDVAFVVLAISFPAWIGLSLLALIGRARYDRRRRGWRYAALSSREARRLVGRARRRPRTEWGRWRRVAAMVRLERAHHPDVPRLIRTVLDDPDPRIATAAVRTLGDIGDAWAIDLLLLSLRRGHGSRSRIASELERLAPAPGPKLVSLLRDANPAVRFWGATLLRPYPTLAESDLIALTWDADANVRAAAVETLGSRTGKTAGTAILAALEDSVWFVRVHAARAAGHVVGADAAPTLVRHLADQRWWVRTAAKDALRGIGSDAIPSLLSALGHSDAFARNGAAEVLQDIGFVDFLALDDPRSPLLERIYAAGGQKLREAAEARIQALPEQSRRAA